MVLVSHGGTTVPIPEWKYLFPLSWIGNGPYGVTVFFVLSGYLITSILMREYDATGRIDIKAFYCRRILRIFPAFYTFLLFIAFLDWRGDIAISLTYFALATAHLINYAQALVLTLHLPADGGSGYWFIGHLWSLSMEEQFYWMWPVTLLLVLRRHWYGLPLVLVLGMPVLRLVSYDVFPGLRGQLLLMLHTGSDAIFSGCLLAIGLARFPELLRRLLVPSWVMVPLAYFFFWGNAVIGHHAFRGYEIMIGHTLIIASLFVLMVNLLQQERETWYHKVLCWKPLVYLGQISYSVYLWQQVFLTQLNTTPPGKWPVNLLCTLAVGWLSYRLIEMPFIQLKDRYFPPHSKPASSAPAPPATAFR